MADFTQSGAQAILDTIKLSSGVSPHSTSVYRLAGFELINGSLVIVPGSGFQRPDLVNSGMNTATDAGSAYQSINSGNYNIDGDPLQPNGASSTHIGLIDATGNIMMVSDYTAGIPASGLVIAPGELGISVNYAALDQPAAGTLAIGSGLAEDLVNHLRVGGASSLKGSADWQVTLRDENGALITGASYTVSGLSAEPVQTSSSFAYFANGSAITLADANAPALPLVRYVYMQPAGAQGPYFTYRLPTDVLNVPAGATIKFANVGDLRLGFTVAL